MRILYLSQYFPPEVGATQTRAYEMAQGLVRAGHQVTMLAEIPNHPSGIVPAEYRGKLYERAELDGIDVVRVWVWASPRKSFGRRLAFYWSYMLSAIAAGLLLRGRFDAMYATSPPLFVGGAGLILSRLRRIPLFFEVRDLWPESAVALGELSNPRAIRWAEWLAERCYRRATRIIAVTDGIRGRLLAKGIPEEKLVVIANGANTEFFRPSPEAGDKLKIELGLDGKFVVLYAGILGIAQGLETVLRAAEYLAQDEQIHFLFVGEGPVKEEMVLLARALDLENVTFHPEVPRTEMPAFLSMADLALVPLRNLALFDGAVPSKMFDAWACGCPTLITVPGEAQRILEAAGAGAWTPPEDSREMAAAIGRLAKDRGACAEMGARGREYVCQHFSRQAQAGQLVSLLDEVLPLGEFQELS